MPPALPQRFDRLLALACREPETVRAALHRGPEESERRRLDFALSVAEARERDHAALAKSIEHPARLHAMFCFWHDLEPKGVLH